MAKNEVPLPNGIFAANCSGKLPWTDEKFTPAFFKNIPTFKYTGSAPATAFTGPVILPESLAIQTFDGLDDAVLEFFEVAFGLLAPAHWLQILKAVQSQRDLDPGDYIQLRPYEIRHRHLH